MIASSASTVRHFVAGFGAAVLLLAAVTDASAQRATTAAGAAAEVVLSALGLIGVPYRYGGSDPASGLDCSGLVRHAVQSALGLQLPRQSEAMSRAGSAVDRGALQPGDLVFFNTLGRPFSHVGVYVGDQQFVHAPARQGRVRVEPLTHPYWRDRFDGARRLDPLATPVAAAASPGVDSLGRVPVGVESDDPFGLAKP